MNAKKVAEIYFLKLPLQILFACPCMSGDNNRDPTRTLQFQGLKIDVRRVL